MIERIKQLKRQGDSCGGVIQCLVRNVPSGLGMPVFDKLEADLAKALMSLPATKGFEIGSGFSGTYLKGSEHNDAFIKSDDVRKLRTTSNNSGGIQGGISNGENIEMKIAFKPTATIGKEQKTGTAEDWKTGLDHAWFVCFTPSEESELLVVAFAQNTPGGGSVHALPMAKEILKVWNKNN